MRRLWLQSIFLAATAGALAACPRDGGNAPGSGGTGESAQSMQLRRGREVYAELRCGICHGDNRQGKPLAPPLTGMAQHWTAEELVNNYFPDPVTYQNKDPRLSAMLKQYSSMKMPPVRGREDDLRSLAEWLLTDP